MGHWKSFFFLAIFFAFQLNLEAGGAQPCASGKSGDFACKSIMLQNNIPLAGFRTFPASASNLWGYVDPDDQHEYAIIGLSNGTAVVDVTNAIKPRVVGVVSAKPSLWREVKVYSVFN
jgi:hypothetical protein